MQTVFPIRWTATLTCTLLIAATAFGQASGNCNWIGGTDNSWHTATNWDCDSHTNAPGSDDAVTIAPGGTVEVQVGADAEAWSLDLGVDDGSSPHPDDHQLRTTVDNVTLTVGDGGVIVRQTGYMQLGQHQLFGIGSQPALRANLDSSGSVLVHGRLFPRNATITADIVMDRPGIGGARGALQARAWNIVHGKVEVVSGFLQPVVPGGHYGTAAPHLRIVGQDLFVAEGSSVQVFADPGTFDAPAISVEGGILDHHGSLTTSSFLNSSAAPIEIDAVVVNSGVIRTRLARPPGLMFSGPSGAVHQNSGEIEIGALFGPETENDAVDGFGLLIEAGRSLHNTGKVLIHRLRSAEGTVANTDGGTITDVTEVATPETYVLGFTGPQAVEVEITDAGTIERLAMIWHGEDHPDAGLHGNVENTDHWWALSATTADDDPAAGDLSLSLPRIISGALRLCRYVESPADWECLATTHDASHATVSGLGALSDWALGDFPDHLFSDRFAEP